MHGRFVDGAISQGGQLLESAKEVTVEKAVLSAGLVYLLMLIGERSVKLYQSYVHPLFTGYDITQLPHELNSVNVLYEKTMDELSSGSLGSALIAINKALKKFEWAANDNQGIYAKLLEKRAEIYSLQGRHGLAEKDLLQAIQLDSASTTAFNLLAHLYINHLHLPNKAEKYLDFSFSLNKEQLFVNFYRSYIAGSLEDANEITIKILKIYQHQFSEKKAAQEAGSAFEDTLAWRTLHHTFPFVCIPHMLIRWMEMNVTYEKDPQVLLSTADSLTVFMEKHVSNIPTQLYVMLKEWRIKVLFEVAHRYEPLQPGSFNVKELALRKQHGLQASDDENKFYFVYSVEHIDHVVTTLFAKGTQTDYLLGEKYQSEMSRIISGWAQKGWLSCDDHQNVRALCHKFELLKSDLGNEKLTTEINAICNDPQTIHHFINAHVKNKGWKPWVRVLLDNNGTISLFDLACLEQGVNLQHHYYDAAQSPAVILPWVQENQQVQASGLQVVYDQSQDQYQFLQELSTLSLLYRWMALNECWQLLKHDDSCNKTVLGILAARGYAALPKMALSHLSNQYISSKSKDAVLDSLETFIKSGNAGREELNSVRDIVANYRNDNQPTSSRGMFSTKVVVGLGLVALGAYCLRK